MKAYCMFDDFPETCIRQLTDAGLDLTVLETGHPRPNDAEMKQLLEENDIVIIGTSRKITEDMWENVSTPRIVATASVGIDHIRVPENKRNLLKIINTPTANAQSVAEYTVGAMLFARKRYSEGNALYFEGKNNKQLIRKPEDLFGSTVGLIGAGNIAAKIIELLQPFGVHCLCYTKNPARHADLTERYGVEFTTIEDLLKRSDIVSVNVPGDASTADLISADRVEMLKDDCIFISISRAAVTDNDALVRKAEQCPNFYLMLDLDVLPEYTGRGNGRNIVFTPHIAGGTVATRKRMFAEVTAGLLNHLRN